MLKTLITMAAIGGLLAMMSRSKARTMRPGSQRDDRLSAPRILRSDDLHTAADAAVHRPTNTMSPVLSGIGI